MAGRDSAGFLIVEDSRTQSELLRRELASSFPGHGIDQAESASAALELLASMPECAGVVCDLDLESGEDSRQVIRDARRRHPRAAIVVVSARMDEVRRFEALAAGADAAMDKGPGTLAELRRRLGSFSGIVPAH